MSVQNYMDGSVVQNVISQAFKPYSAVYIVEHKWSGDGGPESYNVLEEDIEQPAKLCELLGEDSRDGEDDKVSFPLNQICRRCWPHVGI